MNIIDKLVLNHNEYTFSDKELRQRVKELETKINNYNTTSYIGENTTSYIGEELQSYIGELQSYIGDIYNRMERNNLVISASLNDLNSNKLSKEEYQSYIGELQSYIGELQSYIGYLENRISELEMNNAMQYFDSYIGNIITRLETIENYIQQNS